VSAAAKQRAAKHEAAVLEYLAAKGSAKRAELNAELSTKCGGPRGIESTLSRLTRANKVRRETPKGHRGVYRLVPEAERNAPAPSAIARYASTQARERAKRALLHYFRLAIPASAQGESAVEIEAIVDDIIDAAEQGALARLLAQAERTT
jgi:hypothetical protein